MRKYLPTVRRRNLKIKWKCCKHLFFHEISLQNYNCLATHCCSCYYFVNATRAITNTLTSYRCTFVFATRVHLFLYSLWLSIFLAFFAVNQFACCYCWHTNCNATKLLQFCHLQRQTIKRYFLPSFIHSFISFHTSVHMAFNYVSASLPFSHSLALRLLHCSHCNCAEWFSGNSLFASSSSAVFPHLLLVSDDVWNLTEIYRNSNWLIFYFRISSTFGNWTFSYFKIFLFFSLNYLRFFLLFSVIAFNLRKFLMLKIYFFVTH